MAIRIKELFITDLDPNSQNWWSVDKTDKINLNFKQFANGGQIGPQGSQGAYGLIGDAGSQGPQGPQGLQGYQGAIGEDGDSTWLYVTDDTISKSAYIFPKVKSSIGENHAITARIGESGDPTDTNSWYGISIDGSIQSNVLTINNRDTGWSQLVFSDDTDGIFKIGGYNYIKNVDHAVTKIGDYDNAGSFELQFDVQEKIIKTLDFGSITTGTDSIHFTQNLISFNKKVEVNGDVSGKDTVYTKGSGENKVLIPTNISGNLEWAPRNSVFSTFPIGSIVSIQYDEFFNLNNFFLDESVSHESSGNLELRYGRGKEESQYNGWYICNGQTWTSPEGVISYGVPNLNLYNYSINGDGSIDGQQVAIGGDDSRIIIGGYNIKHECTQVDGVYTNQSVLVDTDEVSIEFENASYDPSAQNLVLKNNVNIIYLGQNDLIWSSGSISAPTLYTIQLTQPATSSEISCGYSQNTDYQLSAPYSVWTLSNNLDNISLYKLDNTYANAGWYMGSGISRYWNGTQFTTRVECASTVELAHNGNVLYLNGPTTESTPLGIQSTYLMDIGSFISSTELRNSSTGALAVAGWYRRVSDAAGSYYNLEERRFWTGTAFVGEIIYEDYVYPVATSNNKLKYAKQAQNICDLTKQVYLTYYTTNDTPPSTLVLDVNDMVDRVPYIHLGLSGTIMGISPLINAKDYQDSSGNSFIKIGDITAPPLENLNWANIDQGTGVVGPTFQCSTLLLPVDCQAYSVFINSLADEVTIKYIDCDSGDETIETFGAGWNYFCAEVDGMGTTDYDVIFSTGGGAVISTEIECQ